MNKEHTYHRLAALVPLLASLAFIPPATAANWSTDANRLVQSSVGGDGNVCVTVDADGVATLTGYVGSTNTRRSAKRAALQGDGVVRVINLIGEH